MTVLIITVLADNSPSGVVTYYKTLAQDLRDQGMQVRIIDSLDTPVLWRKFLVGLHRIMPLFGTTSHALYEEFSQFTGAYLAVRGVKKHKFDLVHAQDAKSGAAAFLALNKTVPVVMTCHFNDDPVSELAGRFAVGAWFRNWFSAWYTYLFSRIKNYVFVSNYAYNRSKHLLPADAKRITIYNTVNLDAGLATTHRDHLAKLIISNVGYVDERKNQKLLILIGSELHRRGIVDFEMWFIGDGPKRQAYEQLVASLGLAKQIKFYGQQTDPWRLVAQTDLYIHTALNDNCPYAIIEAFAVETPVLALPVGGIPEMLPQHFGLLRGADVETLTDEIMVYFDPEKRVELQKAQALYADQYFNHRRSLTELVTFYQQTEQVI